MLLWRVLLHHFFAAAAQVLLLFCRIDIAAAPGARKNEAFRLDVSITDFVYVGSLLEKLQLQLQQLDALQQQALWAVVKCAVERRRVAKSFVDRFA